MSELKVVRGRIYFRVRKAGGWGVGDIQPPGARSYGGGESFVGVIPTEIEDGDTVEVTGVEKKHPRFGPQLEVQAVLAHFPSQSSAIVEWMIARLPNVGPERAKALVDRFGANLWEVIESNPAELTAISGITEERAQEICAAYAQHGIERQVIIDLIELGLTAAHAAKAVKLWRGEAQNVVRRNPYRLSIDLDIPLEHADRIALVRLGVAKDDPRRVEAFTVAKLEEALDKGDCSMLRHTLTQEVGNQLKLKRQVVAEQLEDFDAVAVRGKQVLLQPIDAAEHSVASKILGLVEFGI